MTRQQSYRPTGYDEAMENGAAEPAPHFELQQLLADRLVRRGVIKSQLVEEAFRFVPRHLFVPGTRPQAAYRDQVIITKVQDGRGISSASQPAIMAVMLEQLGLSPGQRVLEIGAGTGFNAALIAHIVGPTGSVVTVDLDADIAAEAREHLAAAGFPWVEVACSDGALGCAASAPYDRIILTVGAWDIVPAWWEQLKLGGRLVLPLAIRGPQLSIAFDAVDGHLVSQSIQSCGFMPLRGTASVHRSRIRRIPLGNGADRALIAESHQITAEALGGLLGGPSEDCETAIAVSPWEVWADLGYWLALKDSRLCALETRERAERTGRRPPKVTAAPGIASDDALCVINTPLASFRGRGWRRPANLTLRSWGKAASVTNQLLSLVQEWDGQGRRTLDGMRVTAYRAEAAQEVNAGPVVVDKEWTRLAVDWPGRTT